MEIVQPATGHEALPGSPDRPLLAVIEEQVVAQDLFLFHAGGLSNNAHEPALGRLIPQQGQHIPLGVVGIALVGLPVHMDGQIGNHQQIPVHIHQPGG